MLRTYDCASEGHIPSEIDIAGYSQMVQLDNLRDLLEAFLELLDLQNE
jgi:hypothetical protein